MQESAYAQVVEKHRKAFERGDKVSFDRLSRFYEGKFFTEETGASEADVLATSVNLTFAITETALSTLIPPNPTVSASARSGSEEHRVKASEAFVNYALDASDYRDEMELFVQDAVVLGRGITKTTWDVEQDIPMVRACDPRSVYFDLTTRRPKDIRYFIEATVVSRREMKDRQLNRDYATDRADGAFTQWPKWLTSDTGDVAGRDELKDFQDWAVIYEVYDIEEGRVVHLLNDNPTPIFKDTLTYNPYDILTLNKNGKDCRGLSEIALISPQQEEINHLLTYWLNIVRACVPKGVYDPSKLDEKQLAAAISAGIASWSPVSTRGGGNLKDAIGEFPMPKVPPEALQLLEKVWSNVAVVSALAEAQRGQVTGARTATELALIEGQLRNRLKSRQTRIDRVTENVAKKMLFLMQKYKKKSEILQLTGSDSWAPLSPATIRSVEATFKVTAYSPMESNRVVVQEQFQQMLEFLGNHPNVDQEKLLKVFVEVFDNAALRRYNIIKPTPVQALPGAAPPAGPGGQMVDPAAMAAAAGGAPPSPAAMPTPQMQAIADAQAGSEAMQSPVISPPGMPVGMPA